MIILDKHMKKEQIDKIITKLDTISINKWHLDNIVYFDRTSNPETLLKFFERIQELSKKTRSSKIEKKELSILLEMLDDIDEHDCEDLLTQTDDEYRDTFIENLARTSAIEVLTNGKISFETMNTSCKLSPNDFILCAKRTQDLITSIQSLVIKGETLSKDVAGA